MKVKVIQSLGTIPAEQWNRLEGGIDDPFLRHEFLAGLERFDCVGKQWGWLPRHLTLWDGECLAGAMPLYLKDNSYGELVFDWNWADAYQRAGLSYYPKLVSAVPYSPVTGTRLLIADGYDREATSGRLIEAGLALIREQGLSSLHVLFPHQADTGQLEKHGLLRRTGTQFHWHNRDYRDFEDFLADFKAQRRKKVKRERRRVREAGVEIDILDGHTANDEHWTTFHHFYRSTFERKSGWATLSEPFFRWLGESMPDNIVLMLARHGGRYVAGAFSLRSPDTLYGRHWGCDEQFDSLHFELCYYQGIDYCIANGLARFEPGAQGEHKVWRGFEPTPTWSAHWLSQPAFFEAVERYLEHESETMQEYMAELDSHLPFKQDR